MSDLGARSTFFLHNYTPIVGLDGTQITMALDTKYFSRPTFPITDRKQSEIRPTNWLEREKITLAIFMKTFFG